MAYTPSINDINEISNYQPTLSDALETHAPAAPQSTINQIANSAPVQATLGAGDAIRNYIGDVGGMLPSPFMDLSKPIGQKSATTPMAPSGAGTAYNIGDIAGNIGTFLGSGVIADTARTGMESLPYISKAAQYLGGNGFAGALRQALGTAGYGAITTPQNRTGGAEQGALISAGLSALPGTAGLIGKGINAIRPQQYSDAIIQGLGGGKSLEENAQSLAQDLQGSYQQQVQKTGDILNPIFDRVGSSSVYNGVSPGQSAYQSLNQKVLDSYSPNIDDLHQKFLDDPTLQNAHDLQSQLGSSIGDFQLQKQKGNLDAASKNVMEYQQKARAALKSDIGDFLGTVDPTYPSEYTRGSDYYLNNVVPYLKKPQIAQIATGAITNPGNITNLFKNPEPYIQKIVGDMGSQANNKILYAQLGKYSQTPEKLSKSFEDVKNSGLSSYITPDLEDQFNSLNSKITARNGIQRGSGAALGYAGLSHYGANPELALLIGGAIGGTVSPAIMRGIQSIAPLQSISKAITSGAKKSYPFISDSIKANTANGGQ